MGFGPKRDVIGLGVVEPTGSYLTIRKQQRAACGLVCAGAGMMCGRAHGARSGASGMNAHTAKKVSQGAASDGRGLWAIFAKLFGPACGCVAAAKLAQLAAKFATAWRGKSRSGRRRKSAGVGQCSLAALRSCGTISIIVQRPLYRVEFSCGSNSINIHLILEEGKIMSLNRFAGQVAIITGAASGIGRACAIRFAQEGANIACLDFDTAHNEQTAEECRGYGVETLTFQCDVTHKEDLEAAVASTMQAWGRIDVMVASAGIHTGALLPDVSLRQWDRLISINLTGVFLSNQAVASIMMEQGSGSIINISSMAGKTSWPASAEYSASKSGVIGLTRSVAMELAPHGITCNAVCPGDTLTELLKNVARGVSAQFGITPEEWLQQRASGIPMRRIADPKEVAGVVAFLASEDSRYITGQAIEVDGGVIMC